MRRCSLPVGLLEIADAKALVAELRSIGAGKGDAFGITPEQEDCTRHRSHLTENLAKRGKRIHLGSIAQRSGDLALRLSIGCAPGYWRGVALCPGLSDFRPPTSMCRCRLHASPAAMPSTFGLWGAAFGAKGLLENWKPCGRSRRDWEQMPAWKLPQVFVSLPLRSFIHGRNCCGFSAVPAQRVDVQNSRGRHSCAILHWS